MVPEVLTQQSRDYVSNFLEGNLNVHQGVYAFILDPPNLIGSSSLATLNYLFVYCFIIINKNKSFPFFYVFLFFMFKYVLKSFLTKYFSTVIQNFKCRENNIRVVEV